MTHEIYIFQKFQPKLFIAVHVTVIQCVRYTADLHQNLQNLSSSSPPFGGDITPKFSKTEDFSDGATGTSGWEKSGICNE